MSYTKLALKYRPRKLEELIGQKNVVKIMRGAFRTDRVDRSYLICGRHGSGKTTTARLIATYLNCKNREGTDPPCGTCDVCQAMAKNPPTHHDYIEVNAADTRGIDQIRALIGQARYKPRTNKRVFVLDEVHQLTQQAFQALLKPLEEPQDSTVWILCTTERQKIPAAIASRCTKLDIKPVPPEETTQLLARVAEQEELKLNEEVLRKLSEAAKGHPRDALSILEAAANVMRSGDDFTEDMIPDIVEEVIPESPERIAYAYLGAIYAGYYTKAISQLKKVDSFDYFALKVLETHEHTIAGRASDKLKDPYWTAWNNEITKNFEVTVDGKQKKLLDMDVLVEIMRHLTDAAERVKQHWIDGYHLMFQATVASLQAVHSSGMAHDIKQAHK